MTAELVNAPLRFSLVIFAKNKDRLTAFYAGTLGLEVAESNPTHDRLLGPGVEIVIHAIPGEYAAAITISEPLLVREDTPFKPVFVVPDLESVRAAAVQTGGRLGPVGAARQLHGATVLDGWDPEGNVVQFKQVISA